MSTTTTGTTPTTPTTATEIHVAAIARANELAEGLDTWELSGLARCGTPGGDTEGADALDTARAVATEAAAEHLAELDPAEAVELCAEAAELALAVSDSLWEGVDGSSTLIYTASYREAFAELDGWSEDIGGEFGPQSDMDKAAQLAVFLIMRRAAEAVVERYAEAYTEAVEELGGLPEGDDDTEN